MSDQSRPRAEDGESAVNPGANPTSGLAETSSQPMERTESTEATESNEEEVSDASTDLRSKPILQWTKDDWRRWVEGSSNPVAPVSTGNGGAVADAGAAEKELPAVQAGVPPERPEEAAATEPAVASERPGPVDGDDGGAPAPVPDEVSPAPGPSPEAEQGAVTALAAPEPTAPVEAEAPAPAASAAPPERTPAPQPRPSERVVTQPRGGSQARSAIGLAVLCVVVGVVLAGLVTVALVVAALALRSALG